MSAESPLHNKQQRKKARRKERKQRERQAHRNLDDVTSAAIEQALAAAERVASRLSGERVVALELDLASRSEAQFVRKRVNDALNVDEWLSEVRVELWDGSRGKAMTASGAERGIELRIERDSNT